MQVNLQQLKTLILAVALVIFTVQMVFAFIKYSGVLIVAYNLIFFSTLISLSYLISKVFSAPLLLFLSAIDEEKKNLGSHLAHFSQKIFRVLQMIFRISQTIYRNSKENFQEIERKFSGSCRLFVSKSLVT